MASFGSKFPLDRTIPRTRSVGVRNPSFGLTMQGKECGPRQQIRELTVNGLQGVEVLGSKASGIVQFVAVEAVRFGGAPGTPKLAVIDTGCGMTGEEMEEYLGNLHSTGKVMSEQENFGIGAKVSAALYNPAGVVYLSWKNGQGSLVWFWRDPETKEFGLRLLEDHEGVLRASLAIDDGYKPEQIDDHGTMVILLGQDAKDDTTAPPEDEPNGSRVRWLPRALNARFFRFPENVQVSACEWGKTGRQRSVLGAEHFLEEQKVASGSVDLGNATAHWWILDSNDKKSRNTALHLPGGHTAALYQDEMYELVSGRTAVARLQSFGIFAGHQRVVIYVEPDNRNGEIYPTVLRTRLRIGQKDLPWEDWGAIFASKMPAEIRALIADAAEKENGDYRKLIRDRLQEMAKLIRMPRFLRNKKGDVQLGDEAGQMKGRKPFEGAEGGAEGKGKSPKNRTPKQEPQASHAAGKRPERGQASVPFIAFTVLWQSEEESGLAGRAAHYVASTHTLIINRDFWVFDQIVDRWTQTKGGEPVRPMVEIQVRQMFETNFTVGLQYAEAMRGSGQWTDDDMRNMTSDEALTYGALSNLYIGEAWLRRKLAGSLGKNEDQAQLEFAA